MQTWAVGGHPLPFVLRADAGTEQVGKPGTLLGVLTAVDAGLGACFFGIPADRVDAYREAFGVPAQFTPIGAISIGYSDEPPRDLSSRRRPTGDVVHRGRWGDR